MSAIYRPLAQSGNKANEVESTIKALNRSALYIGAAFAFHKDKSRANSCRR
jgi:hypothetical protein